MNASTHLVATRPADSLGDPGGKDDHEFLFTVVVTCEGCFGFMTFSKVFTTPARDPGAPRGLLGSRGVRRNLANNPGVFQASSRPLGAWKRILGILSAQRGAPRDFAIVLIHYFGPGALQGPRGPLGVTGLFSETLVVHRIVLGGPQGPFGILLGSIGRRPRRSVQLWHHRNAALGISGLGRSQSKKECGTDTLVFMENGRFDACIGFAIHFKRFIICIDINLVHARGNQQTMKGNGSVFVGVDIVDFLNILRGNLDSNNDLPNSNNDLPYNSCDCTVLKLVDLLDNPRGDSSVDIPNSVRNFQVNNSSLCDTACFIGGLKLTTLTMTSHGLRAIALPYKTQSFANGICAKLGFAPIPVRAVLSLCIVRCFMFHRVVFPIGCRDCFVDVDADFPVFFCVCSCPPSVLALPQELRCPSHGCSSLAFLVLPSLMSSPLLSCGDGFVPPSLVWFGAGYCVHVCRLCPACLSVCLLFVPCLSLCSSLSLHLRPSPSLVPCVRLFVGLCHCLPVSLCFRPSSCRYVGSSVGQAALCPRPCGGGPARLAGRVCQSVCLSFGSGVRLSSSPSLCSSVRPSPCRSFSAFCFLARASLSSCLLLAQEGAQTLVKIWHCKPCCNCSCYTHKYLVAGGDLTEVQGPHGFLHFKRDTADVSGSRYRPFQSQCYVAGHKRSPPLSGCRLAERRKGLQVLSLHRETMRHHGLATRWRFGNRPRGRNPPPTLLGRYGPTWVSNSVLKGWRSESGASRPGLTAERP